MRRGLNNYILHINLHFEKNLSNLRNACISTSSQALFPNIKSFMNISSVLIINNKVFQLYPDHKAYFPQTKVFHRKKTVIQKCIFLPRRLYYCIWTLEFSTEIIRPKTKRNKICTMYRKHPQFWFGILYKCQENSFTLH